MRLGQAPRWKQNKVVRKERTQSDTSPGPQARCSDCVTRASPCLGLAITPTTFTKLTIIENSRNGSPAFEEGMEPDLSIGMEMDIGIDTTRNSEAPQVKLVSQNSPVDQIRQTGPKWAKTESFRKHHKVP